MELISYTNVPTSDIYTSTSFLQKTESFVASVRE